MGASVDEIVIMREREREREEGERGGREGGKEGKGGTTRHTYRYPKIVQDVKNLSTLAYYQTQPMPADTDHEMRVCERVGRTL